MRRVLLFVIVYDDRKALSRWLSNLDVAGVDVGNIANGVAGSKRIVIRGSASLTGNNQLLWVIDGIPINSSTLGGPDAYGGVDYGDGLAKLRNNFCLQNFSFL